MIKQFLPPNVNSYMEYLCLSWYAISVSVVRFFVDRRLLLLMKLLNQICLVVKLKLSLWRFYDRHYNWVK